MQRTAPSPLQAWAWPHRWPMPRNSCRACWWQVMAPGVWMTRNQAIGVRPAACGRAVHHRPGGAAGGGLADVLAALGVHRPVRGQRLPARRGDRSPRSCRAHRLRRRWGAARVRARPPGRSAFTGETVGYVSVVAVTAAAAGAGVGRRLMLAAEEWAGQHGCTLVTLAVFAGNAAAR